MHTQNLSNQELNTDYPVFPNLSFSEIKYKTKLLQLLDFPWLLQPGITDSSSVESRGSIQKAHHETGTFYLNTHRFVQRDSGTSLMELEWVRSTVSLEWQKIPCSSFIVLCYSKFQ